jgi:iron complex outermembrane recepter protein
MVALGSVSLIALSFTAADVAVAQSSLPAVTVDAPQPRQARRTAVRRAPTARVTTTRRAAAPLQRVEPVRYVAPSTGTMGAPPTAYAGGQVGTGGQLGFLGNRSVMDTPFNQTSYTAQTIQNQQARTISDVLLNDPSIRLVTPYGNGTDGIFIRGFYYDSGDYALNGLYGIAPYYSTSANFIERVEVLKGPNALLNGMPPLGAVGGSINLITKRAPDFDITQLTATYASKSQFGLNIDVARRYGEQKEWGVRFNGGYRNGNTAYDRQTDEFGNAVLGLDYRGERIRWSADIGYQADNLTPPLRQISIASLAAGGTIPNNVVPPAPAAGTNYMPDWARWKPQDTFATSRAEADIADNVTVYGAIGYHYSTIDLTYPSPALTSVSGNWAARPFQGAYTYETFTGEAGIRTTFDTGPVSHFVTANYSALDRPTTANVSVPSPAAGLTISNLYNPLNPALPTFNTVAQVYNNSVKQSSYGIADTMSILDKRVQLTVGVRRQTAGVTTGNIVPAALISQNGTAESSVWTPAYAIVIKPVEHLSLYANYIEGLSVGQIVGIGFANAGQTFPPYQTKQIEAGVKIDAGRLTTTMSWFEIRQPSLINIATIPITQTQDGEQRNRGMEINVFGEVTPDVRLLGGLAVTKGKLTRTQGGLYDGNSAIGVPTLTVNMGAEWDLPFAPGFTINGRVVYTSDQYVNPENTRKIPEWTRVDLGARYSFLSPWNGKPIVVRANVENVANVGYWAAAYAGGNILSLGAPRTYLLSTTFNF